MCPQVLDWALLELLKSAGTWKQVSRILWPLNIELSPPFGQVLVLQTFPPVLSKGLSIDCAYRTIGDFGLEYMCGWTYKKVMQTHTQRAVTPVTRFTLFSVWSLTRVTWKPYKTHCTVGGMQCLLINTWNVPWFHQGNTQCDEGVQQKQPGLHGYWIKTWWGDDFPLWFWLTEKTPRG